MAQKGMAQKVQVNTDTIEKACTAGNRYLDDTEEVLQQAQRIIKSLNSDENMELAGGQGELIVESYREIERKIAHLTGDAKKIRMSINDKLLKSINAQKDNHGMGAAAEALKATKNANGIKRS